MTIHHRREKRSAKELLPPLIFGTLGIAAVIALHFIIPGFQHLEVVLLLILVGFAALGYTQNIIRGLMSAVMLYFASGIAATFYVITAPYIGAPFGDKVNRNILGLSFCVLTLVVWIILEALGRTSFKDTRLPALGILDSLGSMFIYLLIGVLVISLLFNAIGYGRRGWYAHNNALLRPQFNQVLRLHYTAQSFWFPWRPPTIYVYDLDLPSEQ